MRNSVGATRSVTLIVGDRRPRMRANSPCVTPVRPAIRPQTSPEPSSPHPCRVDELAHTQHTAGCQRADGCIVAVNDGQRRKTSSD